MPESYSDELKVIEDMETVAVDKPKPATVDMCIFWYSIEAISLLQYILSFAELEV